MIDCPSFVTDAAARATTPVPVATSSTRIPGFNPARTSASRR